MKGIRLALNIAAVSMPFACAPFAMAQQPAAGERSSALEEIIVTAQKREENLQKVPIAITALSADMLSKFRVTDLQDLGGLAPNFNVIDQGVRSIPLITIRGITSGAADNAVDPKVGMYLDGVYIGRSVGSIFDLAEIERVEVLRGPQGTLFGRNATAGAVSMITSAPSGEFGLKQDLSFGSRGAFRSRTNLNLPAWGPLSLKLAYLHDENDGISKNLIAGQKVDLSMFGPGYGTLKYAKDLGSKDVDAIMLAARLAASDALTIDYRFDYTDSETVGNPTQQLALVGVPPELYYAQPFLGGITNLSTHRLHRVAAASSVQPLTVRGHNLTLSWDIAEDMSFKSISAYREMDQGFNIYDLAATGGWKTFIDGLPAPVPFFSLLTARSTEQRQFSQELQLTITRDAYTFVGGVYYFSEHSPATNVLGIFSPVIGGMLIPQAAYGSGVNQSVADNDSLAVFAQGTWHATGKLDLTLGVRHTEDDRRSRIIQQSASATGAALPPGVYKTDYGKTNYSLIASYRITPDVMVYAKNSTGYVAGGVMSGIPYDPEELESYEIGVKSQFLDNRLRINAVGYYMDYQDMQEQLFINGVQMFVNAAEAKVKGLELEVEAVPLDGLSLSATLGLTDFEYQKFMLGGVDMSHGFHNIYTPERALRLSGQYDLPRLLFGATPFVRLDARYSSDAYALAQKSADPFLEKLSVTEAHWVLDARAGIASLPLGRTSVNLSVWAKNLLDKDDIIDFGPEVINRTGQFINGRTVGVDLGIEL